MLTAVLTRPLTSLEDTTRGEDRIRGQGLMQNVSLYTTSSSAFHPSGTPIPGPIPVSPIVDRGLLTMSKPGDKAINRRVEEIARKRGVTMAEVAIAWSCGSPWVTAPIVGIRSTERLDELVKGMDLVLTHEERKEIDDAYEPVTPRGYK